MILFLFFHAALSAAQDDKNGRSAMPEPVYVPEPYVCPKDIAIEAGRLQVQSWCNALTDDNLSLMTTGIYNRDATVQSLIYNWETDKCLDSGAAPWNQIMAPLMWNRTRCVSLTPYSIFVDSLNRVIVYANEIGYRAGRITSDSLMFIFEPSSPMKRGCAFKITHQQYFDNICYAPMVNTKGAKNATTV